MSSVIETTEQFEETKEPDTALKTPQKDNDRHGFDSVDLVNQEELSRQIAEIECSFGSRKGLISRLTGLQHLSDVYENPRPTAAFRNSHQLIEEEDENQSINSRQNGAFVHDQQSGETGSNAYIEPPSQNECEPILLNFATDEKLMNQGVKLSPSNKHLTFDGLGLDLDPLDKPSSTNVQDTLLQAQNLARMSERLTFRQNPQSQDKGITLKKKSDFEMRMQYLSKLTYHQVWLAPSKQKKSHQNVIILDWDDTLLPTTFFLSLDKGESTDLEQMARNHMRMLVNVQNVLLSLLDKMIKFAKVVLVTNAKQGWIEYSSFYLLPRVHQLVENYIPIVSAQQEFGEQFPRDPGVWKEKAFQKMWDIDGLLERNCLLNLMVVGDSEYEIEAGRTFKKQASAYTDKRCLLKLIKFKEDPTPNQLLKQLHVLNDKFEFIASSQKSLSIQLEAKQETPRGKK